MQWILKDLNLSEIKLKEALLDCKTCSVSSPLARPKEYKEKTRCCLFKPYLNALSMGHLLQEGCFHKNQDRLVFTPIGVLHSLKERQNYSLYQKQKLQDVPPCVYLDEKTSHCKVWQFRPPTCSSFFCVSESKNRHSFYQNYENLLLSIESNFMKEWFFYQGGIQKDWDLLVDYFDEDCTQELPLHLILDPEPAMKLYRDCYRWYLQQSKVELAEKLKKREDYQFVVEEYHQLC